MEGDKGQNLGAEAGLKVGSFFFFSFLFLFRIREICKCLLFEWVEPGEGEARMLEEEGKW